MIAEEKIKMHGGKRLREGQSKNFLMYIQIPFFGACIALIILATIVLVILLIRGLFNSIWGILLFIIIFTLLTATSRAFYKEVKASLQDLRKKKNG